MSEKKIRVGIIGTGFMGQTHAYGYTTLPIFTQGALQVQLKAVVSRDEAKGREFAQRFGIEKVYTDWRKMLLSDEIDAVSVCTPNAQHKEQVIFALEHGKHVYVDKPITTSVEDTAELCRVAAGKNLVAQIAYNNRFYPSVMRAKELMQEDFCGKLTTVRGCFLHAGLVDGSRPFAWRMDEAAAGGGVLFDLGSHVLDLLQFLSEPVQSVMCEVATHHKVRPSADGPRANTLDEAAYMLLRMQNGARGMVEVTKLSTGVEEELKIEICGEKGALRLDLRHPETLGIFDNTVKEAGRGSRGWQYLDCSGRFPEPGGGFPPVRSHIGWLRPHAASVQSFIEHIYKGASGDPSFEEGLLVQRVMAAAYASSKEGVWKEVAQF